MPPGGRTPHIGIYLLWSWWRELARRAQKHQTSVQKERRDSLLRHLHADDMFSIFELQRSAVSPKIEAKLDVAASGHRFPPAAVRTVGERSSRWLREAAIRALVPVAA